jgi:ribonucleotide monophosphatase NagD (HAD superfamily)
MDNIKDVDSRPKTIICDIDGVLVQHEGDILTQHVGEPVVLNGVHEALREWDRKGYKIILLTGRRESTREQTEAQLARANIIYDQLVMGITGGVRVLINDFKPLSRVDTAHAINLIRNEGLRGFVNL